MRYYLTLTAMVSLTACEALGVKGPSVCEDWVKTQIDNPVSYSWSKSNWSSNGPDVSTEFTSLIDGKTVQQSADCNFVDPDAEQLEVNANDSSIQRWDF